MTMKPKEAVLATRAIPGKVHNRVALRLAAIIHHPLASLVSGLGLLLSGLVEFLESLIGFETVIDAYHGVIVLGTVTTLKSLAYMVEGTERLIKDVENGHHHKYEPPGLAKQEPGAVAPRPGVLE